LAYGIVAGLVVSQANAALFQDLVDRQISFDAIGWSKWFLYVLVPVMAGGLLLHYGLTGRDDPDRTPERSFLACFVGLAVVGVVLRLAVPAILHSGGRRLPRSLADGMGFVAEAARLQPIAGVGGRYEVMAGALAVGLLCAAVAFGALAFRWQWGAVIGAAVVGVLWTGVGWYVPGGSGVRIIGAVWPVFVLGSVGLVLGLTAQRVGRDPANRRT
jgi:hypothetical protein